MRVFTVPHFLYLVKLQVDGTRQLIHRAVLPDPAEVICDHAVIIRSMFESFYCKVETCCIADSALIATQLIQYALVICRVDDDADIGMIFCSSTNHGRSTDIDVFDGIVQ